MLARFIFLAITAALTVPIALLYYREDQANQAYVSRLQQRDAVVDKLEKSASLTTVKMTISVTPTMTETSWWIGAQTEAAYEATGVVQAGIEISDASVTLVGDTIQVSLPAPHLQGIADMSGRAVVDRGVFNLGTARGDVMINQLQQTARKQMIDEACQKDILQAASDSAVSVYRRQLSSIPNVSVSIKPVGDCN